MSTTLPPTIPFYEKEYLDVLQKIIDHGFETPDRTGTGIRMLPGITLKYDISENQLPLWTTRKLKWQNQFIELIWFLNGRTDVKYLQERSVRIWDSWAQPLGVRDAGTIGPGHGKQWRKWDAVREIVDGSCEQNLEKYTIDQFANLIAGIKASPYSRRHIVTLWNPADVGNCILPPCHGNVIQFVVDPQKGLHCLQYQRSADMPLGYCPWQYTMLTHIVAKLCGLRPASLTVTVGNAHVYDNQVEKVKLQLARQFAASLTPTFHINKSITTIDDVCKLEIDDVEVKGYSPQPFIIIPVSV